MRYSILAGWLLLLLLPFALGGRGDQATIDLNAFLHDPALYPAAFGRTYGHILPATAAKAVTTTLPVTLPEPAASPDKPQTFTVKTWRDRNGTVHFSDRASGPPDAARKTIVVQDNSDLMKSPAPAREAATVTRQDGLFMGFVLLAGAIVAGLLHKLACLGWQGVQALAALLAPKPKAEEEPEPQPLAPIVFDAHEFTDPYQVLGLSRQASDKNLRAVYENLRERYAPQNIMGMEPDRQEAARRKGEAIEDAWQRICADRGLH